MGFFSICSSPVRVPIMDATPVVSARSSMQRPHFAPGNVLSVAVLNPCRARTSPRLPPRQPMPRRRLRQTAMATRADAGQTASKTADAGRWPDGSQQTTDGHDPLPEADRGAGLPLATENLPMRRKGPADKKVQNFKRLFPAGHSKPEDRAGLCGSFLHLR